MPSRAAASARSPSTSTHGTVALLIGGSSPRSAARTIIAWLAASTSVASTGAPRHRSSSTGDAAARPRT